METREYDRVVVGSGSGLDMASAAAGEGWDAAVVREGAIGGTCLNRGCIPSKQLLYRAEMPRRSGGPTSSTSAPGTTGPTSAPRSRR